MATTRIKGGRKLNEFLHKANAAKGVDRVEVGFYSTAKYDDGTPVTNVAAWHQFGNKRVPERPYFTHAINDMEDPLINVLKENVNPRTMVVDRITAGKMGQTGVNYIRRAITNLREPPNSPRTIALKRSDNPLIDTGKMRNSATYKVVG